MTELSVGGWIVLAIAAVIIGLTKSALPGGGTVAVALFAAVLPARESTGTILLLLIAGDMFALFTYRRHADFGALLRLAPAVIVGVLGGVVFLAFAGDSAVRVTIGIILLAVIVITLWRRRRESASIRASVPAAIAYGGLSGFTTMVANAAGPIMSMYLLAARVDMRAFLGTSAVFFAAINIFKVPFSVGLGLITVPGLVIVAVLLPLVIIGAVAGRLIAPHIPRRRFEHLVIVLTIVGAVYLLLPFG